MGSWFCDRPRLNFLAFAWRGGNYMTTKRAVMLVKKVTYFGEFGYLNSSCIRKSIILLYLSSSRDKFTLLQQNSVRDVFCWFRPLCWCPCRWAPAWRLHTNLYNQMVLLAQMKRLSLKTRQRFSVFGTCFDVSNIIISHYEYVVKIYKDGRYI